MAPDRGSRLPDYDYVSPGLELVVPDHAFPNMVVGDTAIPQWPYLRRWVEHNWYSDRRNPHSGFTSRDEAAILYNTALMFRGKPCLEVGCWRGWSAVHLALGSGSLDIIDCIFDDPDFAGSIRDSCQAAGVLDRVRFHQGFSPGAIDSLSQSTKTRWSLMFIDADHEGDAPRRDAEAALRNCADTALVLFHDLASPAVAAGLDTMRDAGWRTRVYQTMQIMGVAWRGDIEPVPHIPDPRVFWTLPRHLSGYEVSGWQPPAMRADGGWWPGMTLADRRDAAMMRAQTAENDRDAADHRAHAAETRLASLQAEAAEANAARVRSDHRIAAADAERDAALARAADHQIRVEQLSRESGALEREHEQAASRLEAAEFAIAKLSAERRRIGVAFDNLQRLQRLVLAAGAEQQREGREVLAVSAWVAQKRILLGLLRRSPAARIASLRAAAAAHGIAHIMSDPVVAWLCRRRMLIGLLRRPTLTAEALVGCGLLQAAQASYSRSLRDAALRLGENQDAHAAPGASPDV